MIVQLRVPQGEEWWNVIRWTAPDGTPLVPADVTTWHVIVFPIGSGNDEVPLYQTSPTAPVLAPAGPWYSALSVDGFAFDAIGYNFRHSIGAANIPTVGGARYRYTYVATTSAWGKRTQTFEVEMLPTGL